MTPAAEMGYALGWVMDDQAVDGFVGWHVVLFACGLEFISVWGMN